VLATVILTVTAMAYFCLAPGAAIGAQRTGLHGGGGARAFPALKPEVDISLFHLRVAGITCTHAKQVIREYFRRGQGTTVVDGFDFPKPDEFGNVLATGPNHEELAYLEQWEGN
jgi:hypothetical protein